MLQQLKPSTRRLRPSDFAPESPIGPYRPQVDFRPFTTARIDEKLFGNHNGITLPGPIITMRPPINQGNVPPRMTTLRGNPWYMAPGWNASRRKIDLKRYLFGGFPPKLFTNPWDRKYGIIGTPPSNLEVIRANQMGRMSFV